jgi:hypothetical protein
MEAVQPFKNKGRLSGFGYPSTTETGEILDSHQFLDATKKPPGRGGFLKGVRD